MRFAVFGLLLLTLTTAIAQGPHATADQPAHVPPQAGWVMTASFPAAEAHQAAAADEECFYVINNTTVAAYERLSGRRKWLSHGGEATHLNSGFVWQERLLCAHSNYPAQPTTSEIKVVDLSSGELSDFKTFGVTDGSLTWVVRHREAWWCNFAYYGGDQQQTRLVRYDDDWRETGRWTYPEALFSFLGRYSLSGGVWDGETLLVSGHDHPFLYRLRLPSVGNVLQWVDRRSVPFPGQGFAVDPLRGARGGTVDNSGAEPPRRAVRSLAPTVRSENAGDDAENDLSLVGIDRGKRLVILAGPGR